MRVQHAPGSVRTGEEVEAALELALDEALLLDRLLGVLVPGMPASRVP